MSLEQHRLLGGEELRMAAAQGVSSVGLHVAASTDVGARRRSRAAITQKNTTEDFILEEA